MTSPLFQVTCIIHTEGLVELVIIFIFCILECDCIAICIFKV